MAGNYDFPAMKLHPSGLSVAVAHALLLGFTCTSSFILALLGIEGVTDRDIQTMATASCFLHSVEETTIVSHILHATLEHIVDAGTQAQGIVLQPALLYHKTDVV
jgi:hypothetical protein